MVDTNNKQRTIPGVSIKVAIHKSVNGDPCPCSMYVSVSVKIDTVVKDRQASIDPFRVRVRVRIRDELRSERFFTDTDGFMH